MKSRILQFRFDNLSGSLESFAVQPDGLTVHNGKCKREEFGSRLQRRYGVRLNTSRQARAACGVASLRTAPARIKTLCGEFLPDVEPRNHWRSRKAGQWRMSGAEQSEHVRLCLIGRASRHILLKARGCNSPVRQYRVARFATAGLDCSKCEATDRRIGSAKQTTSYFQGKGWFVLAHSLWISRQSCLSL